MEYPETRDRLVAYIASWSNSLKPDDQILISSLALKHICATGEICWLEGRITLLRNDELAVKLIAPFRQRLAALGITFSPLPYWSMSGAFLWNITMIKNTELKFDSSIEIVAFINEIAAALNHPPVSTLRKEITTREVFVNFMSGERQWIDEAYWLTSSAKLPQSLQMTQEDALMCALLRMRKPSHSVRLTLRPTLDSKTAIMLCDAHSKQFVLSLHDCDKLLAVGKPDYIPQRMRLTLGFYGIISGPSEATEALAPHIQEVEFIIGRANNA
jgi:hypothetical protein